MVDKDASLAEPFADPVADHTWCCEHPEPWRYFRPEARDRLLSGLSRVYRVDPVEAAWSLRTAAWIADETAADVLEVVSVDDALPPHSRAEALAVLRAVAPERAQSVDPRAEVARAQALGPRSLLDLLAQARSPELSRAAADAVWHALPRFGAEDKRRAVLELAIDGHPGAADWLAWLLGGEAARMGREQRLHLLVALAAFPMPAGRATAAALLARETVPASASELVELARALDRATSTEDERAALRNALENAPWWPAARQADAENALVVEAALRVERSRAAVEALHRGPLRALRQRRLTAAQRRACAEACGIQGATGAVPMLGSWLNDPMLGVRRESAKALWRLGASGAEALAAHLRTSVARGKALLDVEGVDVVRYAADALLRERPPGAADALAALLERSWVKVHDLHARIALVLCAMGDDRAGTRDPDSGLPWALQASLTPLSRAPWEAVRQPVQVVARWLERKLSVELRVPAQQEWTHLERVHLQQRMLAAWDAAE